MTTEYTYPSLGLNNNQVYVQLGTSAIIDTYTFSSANQTNQGWTVNNPNTSKISYITPTVGNAVHKASEKTATDVECKANIIGQNANSYLQSPTFAAGTRNLNVTILGGSIDSNDPRFKVVAYNSNNEAIATVNATQIENSTGAKVVTHFYTTDAVKDSNGNFTIPVTATEDIAYIRILVIKKDGTDFEKVNSIYSVDVEAVYPTDGVIFKNYVGDIEFPATAKPWKLADGTMSDTVQGTTATFADGLITADASASGAKIYSRASSWCQFVTGAKLTFKVKPGATIKFNTYSAGTAKYSVNGGTAVTVTGQAAEFTVDHLSTIVIEALGNDWISDITVTF